MNPVSGVGMALPAGSSVAQQEHPGQPETVLVLVRPAIRPALASRKTPAAATTGPCTARLARRDTAPPDLAIRRSGRRSRWSPRSFPDRGRSRARPASATRSGDMGGRPGAGRAVVQRVVEHGVDVRMRIALRQKARQRGKMGHSVVAQAGPSRQEAARAASGLDPGKDRGARRAGPGRPP